MNKQDINDGLTGRIENSAISGVAYPNVKAEHDRPWYEIFINATSRTDGTLKGGEQVLREVGVMTVVVVAEKDIGEFSANTLAQAVSDLFLVGTKFSITGGEITIQNPALIGGGFADGSEWRIPVTVGYVAIAD